MEKLTAVAALVAPSLAILAFVADSARRTRSAIRETLELADQFRHSPDTARRLRARAGELAATYLKEAERGSYPVSVTLMAWGATTFGLVVAGLQNLLPRHPSAAESLAAGFVMAIVAIALRPPIAAAVHTVRSVNFRSLQGRSSASATNRRSPAVEVDG